MASLTRAELMEKYGLSRHAMKKLWAGRAENGHPEPVEQVGKAMYWDDAAWAAWFAALTPPEPELVSMAEAGRLLGLAPSTVTVYAGRPPRGWPEPVSEQALGGGRVRRMYRRADVLAYGRD
ncbi:MAG: hypothetical protein ABIS86_22190 [Streptosporangiaceae bacterium]